MLKVIDLVDWRGGYATDIPAELMKDNELLTAENCQWRDMLVKRNGIDLYDATDLSTMIGLKGGIRAYINSTWYTIIAVDDDTNVRFYAGTTTTFTEIDNTFTWTTETDVQFAELLGYVVAVNGTDKPAVIYWDSALVIENLETLDTRDRNEVNWWAGQWDNGATSEYVDDTTDAQDAGTEDFQLGNATQNDGFYVSCDFTFNKIVMKNCEDFGSEPTTEYAYWNGSSWTTITPSTLPVWDDAEADKVIEFTIPLDSDGNLLWEVYGEDETTDGIENRYVFRVRFTGAGGAGGAFDCDYIELYHTQYLTQIFANARPHAVCSHNGQMFLAERNIINMAPPNQVTGWREGQVEYFVEGGAKIMQMVSFADTLVVLKENTIYTFDTNNLMSPVRSRPLTGVGTVSMRSGVVVGDVLFFVGIHGIYIWDGSKAIEVSKHIQTDIDAYTLTNAAGIFYQGEYWISFPTNSIVLTCDPDTFRRGSMGQGMMSFYKFTDYKVSQFIYNNGDSDNGILQGLVDQSSPYILRCDYGTYDDLTGTATTAIDMTIETKYFSSSFQKEYYLGRLKPKIKQVSSVTGKTHTLTLQSNDGTVSVNVTLTVSTGTGYYSEDISIPYTIDGKNFSIKLNHNAATAAGLIGFAFMIGERRF